MSKTTVAILSSLLLVAACGNDNAKNDKASADKAGADKAGAAAADKASAGEAQPNSGSKGPGSWVRITKNDGFKELIGGAIAGGTLYHAVKDGTLYATDLASGEQKTISRKPDFGAVRWMFANGDALYSLDRDGTLWSIDAKTAARKAVGEKRGFSDTIAAASAGDNMFTVEKDGKLYRTPLATGSWKQIGKADFADTRLMFGGANGKLVSVEKDGSAFNLDTAKGDWFNRGDNGKWKHVRAAAWVGDKLYRVTSDGVLATVDEKGAVTPLGQPDFAHVVWMGSDGTSLITLETDGSLYRVAVE